MRVTRAQRWLVLWVGGSIALWAHPHGSPEEIAAARAVADAALASHAPTDPAWQALALKAAWWANAASDWAGSLRLLDAVLARDAACGEAHVLRHEAVVGLGDNAAAETDGVAALRLHAGTPWLALQMARAANTAHATAHARELLDLGLDHFPTDGALRREWLLSVATAPAAHDERLWSRWAAWSAEAGAGATAVELLRAVLPARGDDPARFSTGLRATLAHLDDDLEPWLAVVPALRGAGAEAEATAIITAVSARLAALPAPESDSSQALSQRAVRARVAALGGQWAAALDDCRWLAEHAGDPVPWWQAASVCLRALHRDAEAVAQQTQISAYFAAAGLGEPDAPTPWP